MLGSQVGFPVSLQSPHWGSELALGSISGVLRQTAQESRSLEKNRKCPNPNKCERKKKNLVVLFFLSGLKNVENLGNATRFVKQDIPAVTQPGRSAWAAVLVILFWGEHCWQDIQWSRDLFQLHQLDLCSHSAVDLMAAGAWRSSKSSLTLQRCWVAQCWEELLHPTLTAMFPSVSRMLV